MLTILGTILGGLISGMVGLFIEERRRKNDAKIKHFEDLKRECLMPIRAELYKWRECFKFSESRPPPRAHSI
ncbi:MAG: hypothetical protein ACPLYF_01885, partial [Fervidobacterium sp.]